MPLVARASTTVRNKNILIALLCLGFLVWFAYDGFVTYPNINDRAVVKMRDMMKDGKLRGNGTPEQLDAWKTALNAWPGWNNASKQQHDTMAQIATEAQTIAGGVEGWKRPFDIVVQRALVYGLVVAVIAALWWMFHCQQRRAIADDSAVSPAKNISVPWENITIVDNTRWKKSGIVEITWLDSAGQPHKATFDDYELDREPLLQILDLLAEKAHKAEFIPKEDPAP